MENPVKKMKLIAKIHIFQFFEHFVTVTALRGSQICWYNYDFLGNVFCEKSTDDVDFSSKLLKPVRQFPYNARRQENSRPAFMTEFCFRTKQKKITVYIIICVTHSWNSHFKHIFIHLNIALTSHSIVLESHNIALEYNSIP